MAQKVRTRYAPSPTGKFHIGGARTALFNYLFAKHHDGTFIVRIEDTDIKRNIEGAIDSQLDNLEWLNIHPDESIRHPGKTPPYIQSANLEMYKKLALDLVKQNKAYYCFCTKEQLQQQRDQALAHGLTPKYNRACLQLSPQEVQQKIEAKTQAVIRLKMPDNVNIEWKDLIRGDISVPTSALTDPVILKSDGMPMYNFAVVVDDYHMQITHVLRGEEHLSNTPYQIAIKKSLGYDQQPIEYGHLSIIIDETGKKLSKRNLGLKQFVEDYRNEGYIPEAVTNFLALLGWTSIDAKEILNMAQTIKAFDIKRVSKAPAFFDEKKLAWLSNHYIKNMDTSTYLKWINQYLEIETKPFNDKLNEVLLIFKDQISFGKQINELIIQTFLSTKLNKEIIGDAFKQVESKTFIKCIQTFKDVLVDYDEITLVNADDIVNKIQKITGFTKKDLFFPLRFAAIAQQHGPQMNKILYIVGKKQILENIEKIIGLFKVEL